MPRRIFNILLLLALSCGASEVFALSEVECGTLDNPYGPFDYTSPYDYTYRLPKVEHYHFNQYVEELKSGALQGHGLLPDIDYTLRAFPNHHRALYAIVRYRLKHPWHPGDEYRSAECYLWRALQFKPSDGEVYLIYGLFLHKKGNLEEAMKYYEKAIQIMPTSAEAHYDIGLLYYSLGDKKKAKEHAIKAYKFGYQLNALKDKLIKDGLWKGDEVNDAKQNDSRVKKNNKLSREENSHIDK